MAKSPKSYEEERRGDAYMPEVVQSARSRRRNAPVVASAWLTESQPSSADGLTIKGDLECDMVHHQKQLTVAKSAFVKANIQAGTVVVFGELTGNIDSPGRVVLVRGSKVQGKITCKCLHIEEGARFGGQVQMDECVDPADLEYA